MELLEKLQQKWSAIYKKKYRNLYKHKNKRQSYDNDTYVKSHDTEWHSCLPSASDIWSWT